MTHGTAQLVRSSGTHAKLRPRAQVTRVSGGGAGDDAVQVDARGELQLGLLIESMRRDKFEMEISAPRVLLRHEGGRALEPIEEATLELPAAAVGAPRSSVLAAALSLTASNRHCRCGSHPPALRRSTLVAPRSPSRLAPALCCSGMDHPGPGLSPLS
jgi:hypothetical protein